MSDKVRKMLRNAKNNWNNYSEIEILVREATSNDPWGVSSHVMQRIARESEIPANYHSMIGILWKRLVDFQHIKHVLKALNLIDYLLRHGPERFVSDVKLRMDTIRRLKGYKYIKNGRDIGQDVRRKANNIVTLVKDNDRLRKERQTAKSIQGKIIGYAHNTAYAPNDLYSDAPSHNDPFDEHDSIQSNDLDLSKNESEGTLKSEQKPKQSETKMKVKKKSQKKKKLTKKRPQAKKGIEVEEPFDVDEEPTKDNNKEKMDDQVDNNMLEEIGALVTFEKNDISTTVGIQMEYDWITGTTSTDGIFLSTMGINEAPVISDSTEALFDSMDQGIVRSLDNNSLKLESNVIEGDSESNQSDENDVWEEGMKFTYLDNILMSKEEREFAKIRQQRKLNKGKGMKLKDMASNKKLDAFDALVQGQNASSNNNSMYGGEYHHNNQLALVPIEYSYRMDYPMMQNSHQFDPNQLYWT